MVAQSVRPEREVRFQLYPAQDDFVADTARYVAFVGGRNSGKTYAGSVKAALRSLEPGLGVIGAPDFPMLEDGAKRQYLARLGDLGLGYVQDKQRNKVFIPKTGAEVTFATLETESRVRSPNYAWGWIDEVEFVADSAIWRALKGAVRDGLEPQLFVTSTPKGRYRVVYPEWVQSPTVRHRLYRASTRDNPFIDADDYISGLSYEGRFYLQEIEAEFVAFEGVVYPGFSIDRNVRAVDCDGWRTILGIDVGSRNPTAILTIRVASDDRRHVEREVYRRGMSSDDITDAVAMEMDETGAEIGYMDPSAKAYIESLQRRGYNVVAANNDVTYGIGVVTTAIADGLTVDPSCVNTIAEMESYHYPEKRANDDKPEKQGDHSCDALRYGLVGTTTMGLGEAFSWL